MCSARITTTVCVASHNAIPIQIAAIQYHLGARCPIASLSMPASYSGPSRHAQIAANCRLPAASGPVPSNKTAASCQGCRSRDFPFYALATVAANHPLPAATGLAFTTFPLHTPAMVTNLKVALLSGALLLSAATLRLNPSPSSGPEYTSDGRLRFPEHYREWVYLTTGFDMSYNPAMDMGHHMFDNVFVNREAYQAFLETGTWPDKTMLVLEGRRAETKGSINKAGHFQGTDTMGVEV